MKRMVMLGFALLVGLMFTVSAAQADSPTVNITAPTAPIYAPSFPYAATIVATVSHPSGQLSDLNVFNVEVAQLTPVSTPYASLTGAALGNPFPGNACSGSQMIPANGVTSCSVTAGVATIGVAWSIPSAGTYMVKVSVKHHNAVGFDTEEIAVALQVVEYPAPPSVANAFISGNPAMKKISPTVRGCVIAQIAQNHTERKYGPAPGPYNISLIQNDVLAYWPGCGG